MLSRYSVVEIEDALRAASPEPPFPTVDDRAAWEEIGLSLGPAELARIANQAEADALAPLPTLTATLYLDFLRTGARDHYERPAHQRRAMLWNLALAECLENQGRFLDSVLDLAWAICEESSWAWPAHQGTLTDPDRPVIDLSAAMTALTLAELDLLLGPRLDPALGHRIRAEVDRRCLTPYLDRHDHWWLHGSGRPNRALNNWTAVCNGGVVGAALYLADPARVADIVARGLRSLDDYVDTFDPDGGSAEGPGYWSYGFGYFTILAHLIEQRTEGKIRLLDGERMEQIAKFPLRTLLSPGQFVNFSDCDLHVRLTPAHLAFLARRLDLQDLMRLAAEQRPSTREHELTWGLRSLVWRPEQPGPDVRFTPARHDWLGGQMWLIARYDPGDAAGLVLAAKGGHNDEPHNQNDCGSFIVHIGGESIVADPGRGRYTRFYFGPQRYQHLVCTSRGHSVPVPNGREQAAGSQYHATLLDRQADDAQDRLVLELNDAYPADADLASLRRTLTLHRRQPGGAIELEDAVRFASGPGRLESVLVTFGQVVIEPAHVVLSGQQASLRVAFDADVVAPRVELELQVDLAEGPMDLRRVVFELKQPSSSAEIRLLLEPL